MWDLLRFFAILLTGVILGCAGYFVGFMAFPNLSHAAARIAGAVVGGLLGMMIAVWINSRHPRHLDRPL